MEKKWDTVIPADLKGLFVKWDIYVPLVTKGLTEIKFSNSKCNRNPLDIFFKDYTFIIQAY